MKGRWLGALVVAALAVSSARAAGGLRIRVIDNADKSAVIGAAVTISSANKLVATTTLLSDKDGTVLFPVLREGSGYVITVIMDGYAGIRQDATVSGNTQKDIVIALVPEHVEKVTVVGEKTTIDLDQTQAQTKFSSDFIQDLPVAGRFYQNVLALAPGVQDPDNDGNPNVNGARETDFKTQVGGISNVDPLTGTFLNLVTADSIEDLTVVTAGAGAEYGRAQGGFAQIIQKQGSNDFEGVFGMLYRSSKLDGNGATNLPNSLLPDFYLYQPSLQVSGPVIKDKLWYRLSQEAIRREDPLVLASGGTVATTGTKQFSTDNQLTWQVSNRNKIAFNMRADPRELTNVGISVTTPVESSLKNKSGGPTYQMTWTAPYSPSLLVDSTVAYQDTRVEILPTRSGVANNCVGVADPWLAGTYCFDALTGLVSGSFPLSQKDRRQRLSLKSDATYYKGRLWGAQHQFKTGLVVENERYFLELLRTPNFTRSSGFDINSNKASLFYNINASLEPFSQQRATGTTWGVYGEDVIRPLSNLSVTVGLRVENEDVSAPGYVPFDPQEEANRFMAATDGLTTQQKTVYLQQTFIAYEDLPGALSSVAVQFPGTNFTNGSFADQLTKWTRFRQPDDISIHNTNISPRLSVAWDPWNDGKTRFSASAGRYYDKLFLGVLTPESQPIIVNFEATSGSPNIAFEPTFGYSTVSRDLKTPHQDEYSFAVERQLWQESTISLRYIHRDFSDQLQDIDTNQVPGDYGKCFFQASVIDPTLVASPGTGPVVDAYTGKTYQDTDPGDGDGRLDDCTGRNFPIAGTPGVGGHGGVNFISRPDQVADLYVLNPAWGNIFQIGNYNSQQYDGITLEFVRRQYKNWQMEASYTYSKAKGQAEAFNLGLGDDRSTLEDEKGYQSYDRRHALKVNATTITPWGFRLGGTVNWQSGLPYSILVRQFSLASALPAYEEFGQPFTSVRTKYATHRRNDQRNRSAWNFDAKLVKEVNLPKGMNLQLTAEIFNLLNEDTYAVYNENSESGQQVNGTNDATRRFGRQYQIGVRLAF
ncbi:MAG TPA: TonB-dependent receptor [Candidatus Polarisedimenticolaceae bacterium]|nr:TonB-dependent receptor [Candidatus Polarisedimenticolaceae bacterium]